MQTTPLSCFKYVNYYGCVWKRRQADLFPRCPFRQWLCKQRLYMKVPHDSRTFRQTS